jgi:hypothetical protein
MRRAQRLRFALDHRLPLSAGLIPKITSAVSVRPEPNSPARPTISPGRTSRSNGAMVPFLAEAFKRGDRFIAQQGTPARCRALLSSSRPSIILPAQSAAALGFRGSRQSCRCAAR